MRINPTAVYAFSSVRNLTCQLNHLVRRLNGNDVSVGFGNIEFDHIARLNICKHSVKSKQFRKIGKLRKSRLCPVSLSARCKFKRSYGFAKICRPCVKVVDSHFLQCVFLQVRLQGIHFRH